MNQVQFRCQVFENLKNRDLWNRCSGVPGAPEIVSGKVLDCSKPVSMVSDQVGMSFELRIANLHFAEKAF